MSCYTIIAMRIGQRMQAAAEVQETLTKFGCNIKARLGLHEASGDACANDGIVLLQVCGEKDELLKLVEALNGLESVKAKLVDLDD